MRTAWVIGSIVVVMTLSSFGGVSAASHSAATSNQIVADLEGRPIKPDLIPTLYCHDFDFPRIHCFRSALALDSAAARRTTASGTSALSAGPTTAFTVNDYVTIFDGPNYSGAAMDVSQNYDVLWSIGWNDRISSYKARNSAAGEFWTDWFASGTGRTFCCDANVSSLPSNLDNAFSSVYRH